MEVYAEVKRRRICRAEELFELAQNMETNGSDSLLLYCTGEHGGMKRNLQATVDAVWREPDATASNEEHQQPLTLVALQRLKERAQTLLRPLDSTSLVLRLCPTSNPILRIKDAKLRTRKRMANDCQRQETLPLFDQFGSRAEVLFRPRGGVWRLRDFYELLCHCRQRSALAGVTPSKSAEGGLSIPRSEDGWHEMLRTDVANPRVPFRELSDVQVAAAASELRLGVGCGALNWSHTDRASWMDSMPEDAKFDEDTQESVHMEERLVRVFARQHVEPRQLLAFMEAVKECGHSVTQTCGFMIDNGRLAISSPANPLRHKAVARGCTHGIANAMHCAADTEVRRIFGKVGSATGRVQPALIFHASEADV